MARFTKQAIMNTFVSLISERTLDKITVTDIVRACGINRNTFYYYFHDIYALAAAVLEQQMDAIFSAASPNASFEEIFGVAAAAARRNRRVILHIYQADHVLLQTQLYRAVKEHLLKRARAETEASGGAQQEELALTASIYAHAAVGSFVHWLGRGMREPTEQTIRALSALLTQGLRPMLTQPQTETAEEEVV